MSVADEETSLLPKKKWQLFSQANMVKNTLTAIRAMKNEHYIPIDTSGSDFNSRLLRFKDHVKLQTNGRIIARWLSKFKFYFPQKDIPGAPSLEKAWAYFEHVTLPRYYVKKYSGNASLWSKLDKERAPIGEADYLTELYSFRNIEEDDFGTFGIGIALYFASIRWFGIMLFVAGLFNIPSMYFYAKGKYHNRIEDLPILYRFSAVCGNTETVTCSDCVASDFGSDRVLYDDNLGEAFLKNKCSADDLFHGYFHCISLLILFGAVFYLQFYQGRLIVHFDENEQTAQDYSIVVRNPPKDACAPDEWRDFFTKVSGGDGPILVTVGLDNGKLLALHAKHRQLRDKIDKIYHDRYEDKKSDKKALNQTNTFGETEYHEKLKSLETKINHMRRTETFHASQVYVTFDTEEEQRQALNNLSTGLAHVFGFLTPPSNLPLFRGRNVLYACEAAEPSCVRWIDFGISLKTMIRQVLLSNILVIGLIVLCASIIDTFRSKSYVAFIISLINALIPQVLKAVNAVEKHFNETSSQISLYVKVTVFRWCNTAILITVITPFTSTLSDGDGNLLNTVVNIFIAEVLTSPIIRMLDIPNVLKRHILAPRAQRQIDMIRNFSGAKVCVAERYTEATKIVFLSFYYSVLLPNGFFLGAVALFVYYQIDKYCLFRSWARMGKVDKHIANFQRRYFLWFSIMFLSVMTVYNYSSFPFDNLCKEPESDQYYYCNQDLMGSMKFPGWSEEETNKYDWMTQSQQKLIQFYSKITIAILIICSIASVGRSLYELVVVIFQGSYDEVGSSMNISYSEVPSIFAYVPQFHVKGFLFPFIACDISAINKNNIYWKNPNVDHSYYCIVDDVLDEEEGPDIANKPIYSVIKDYRR